MILKRKKVGGKINTEGWMMSYADMATILLAMFIVLSTFGKDQTGATLQKGLESWKESRQFFGLPGLFGGSSQQHQFDARSPHYLVPDDDGTSDDASMTIDAELEKLKRFLDDPSGQAALAKLPEVRGQATLDFFRPLGKAPRYLTPEHVESLSQVIPLLSRDGYSVTVIVWATMPVDSALTRAAEQAAGIAQELQAIRAPNAARTGSPGNPIIAVAQPWRYAFYQRPIFSVVIRRLEKR